MKSFYKNFNSVLITWLVLLASCTNDVLDEFNQNASGKNEYIKSEVVDGKTTSKYIYNSDNSITEMEGLYFYSRYNYNAEGQLIKRETAVDPATLSSNSTALVKTELMTSENCSIDSYQI